MKKYLPNSRGFTLIELMVVVVIIAILSIVGISLFTTAQKNARDGVRRAELTGLGKSIESTKDPNSGNFKYTGTLYGDDFPQIKAMDPLKDPAKPQYCVATSDSTGPTPDRPGVPTSSEWSTASPCPSNAATVNHTAWGYLVNNTGAYNNTATNLLQSGSVKYWRICAKLEISGDSFCVTSNNN